MKRSSVVQNVEKSLVSASFLIKKEYIEKYVFNSYSTHGRGWVSETLV